MTFPLQELIQDIANTNKSLSDPLFKLNLFGQLINNEELIGYTDKEINGYSVDEDVPEYRKTAGILRITIQAGYNKHDAILPSSMLEDPFKDKFRIKKIHNGIATIESMQKEISQNGTGEISSAVPMEFLSIFQEPARKLYRSDVRISVVGASFNCSKIVIGEILSAVRMKLLNFVMKIAKEFGYTIEIDSFNKNSDNNQTINYFMSTTINNNGDGNLINTGDNNEIHNKVKINKGDLTKLQQELRDHGIEEEDIQEITSIIQEEAPDLENDRLGPRANNWILGIIGKSLNGIGKIGTAVTANLLASLIKGHLGMGI